MDNWKEIDQQKLKCSKEMKNDNTRSEIQI